MQYRIRHVTRFSYERGISESVMEARMQPRSDGSQRCLHFGISTQPSSRVMMYQDHQGNVVHHFNIPGRHTRLTVTAEAVVDCAPLPDLPDALAPGAWERLDALTQSGEFWDLLSASVFARRTPRLDQLLAELDLGRGDDPLVMLRHVTSHIHRKFEYSPRTTRVDSPIDEALEARRGVCQDFAHIMIALIRPLGVPCRYVSGYLYRQGEETIRSSEGATHAWLEAFLPEVGWVGFDPTNNVPLSDRHIRVATGRDYADVPPTRGVFKGLSAVRSELAVGVSVGAESVGIAGGALPFVPWMSREAPAPLVDLTAPSAQQQ